MEEPIATPGLGGATAQAEPWDWHGPGVSSASQLLPSWPLAPTPWGWAPCHLPDGTSRGWDMGVREKGRPGYRSWAQGPGTDGLASIPSTGCRGQGGVGPLLTIKLGFKISPCGGGRVWDGSWESLSQSLPIWESLPHLEKKGCISLIILWLPNAWSPVSPRCCAIVVISQQGRT